MFTGEEREVGSITVIALVTLVLLTILGISVSRITTVDIRIYGNERTFKERFYIAEGGGNREAQELGNGGYPVGRPRKIEERLLADNKEGIGAPFPHLPHAVNGEDYNFTVKYMGYDNPIPQKGYGVLSGHVAFNFDIDSQAAPPKKGLTIISRYCKIGPRPE